MTAKVIVFTMEGFS
uniref:Uncharacterized protein n=1 Tax=Anguilla anguilla TaxID=7936 RepID=A0A0E9QYG0_ANGAN